MITRSKDGRFVKGDNGIWRGRHHTVEAKAKMSLAHSRISDETRQKMRQAKLGRKLSEETKQRMSLAKKGKIPKNLAWMHETFVRERHPSWRGGIAPMNKIIRGSLRYREWRESVFARDNWTCIWCGIRGGILHPDHIKPFALYPELRFELSNGRTLCVPCHKLTDTYAGRTRKESK